MPCTYQHTKVPQWTNNVRPHTAHHSIHASTRVLAPAPEHLHHSSTSTSTSSSSVPSNRRTLWPQATPQAVATPAMAPTACRWRRSALFLPHRLCRARQLHHALASSTAAYSASSSATLANTAAAASTLAEPSSSSSGAQVIEGCMKKLKDLNKPFKYIGAQPTATVALTAQPAATATDAGVAVAQPAAALALGLATVALAAKCAVHVSHAARSYLRSHISGDAEERRGAAHGNLLLLGQHERWCARARARARVRVRVRVRVRARVRVRVRVRVASGTARAMV